MTPVLQYRSAVWELKSERNVAAPKPLDPARLLHHETIIRRLWGTLNNAEHKELETLEPTKVLNP